MSDSAASEIKAKGPPKVDSQVVPAEAPAADSAAAEIRLTGAALEKIPENLRALLRPGAVVEATVVETSPKTDSASPKQGVEIAGQLLEAELPPDLKNGEKLTVRVEKRGAEVLLVILKEPGPAAKEAAEPSQPAEAGAAAGKQALLEAKKAVELLLKTAGIDSFDPKLLRAGLSQKLEKLVTAAKLPPEVLSQALSEEQLKDPARLTEALKQTATSVYLRIIAAKDGDHDGQSSPAVRYARIERELERLLQKYLPERDDSSARPEEKTASAPAGGTKQLKTSGSTKPGATGESGFIQLEKGAETRPALTVLKELLNNLHSAGAGSQVTSRWDEQALLNALKTQLEIRESAVSRLKEVLLTISKETMAETLLRTLTKIEKDLPQAREESEKRFALFVRELKEEVAAWLRSEREPEKLKPVLKAALARIEKEFPLQEPESAAALKEGARPVRAEGARQDPRPADVVLKPEQGPASAAAFPKLSEPYARALRAIEGQIRLILSAPSSAMTNLDAEPVKKLLLLLKGVEESALKQDNLPAGESDLRFKNFVVGLRKSLEAALDSEKPRAAELLKSPQRPQASGAGMDQAQTKELLHKILLQALKNLEGDFSERLPGPAANPQILPFNLRQALLTPGDDLAEAIKGIKNALAGMGEAAAPADETQLPETQKKALRIIQGYLRLIVAAPDGDDADVAATFGQLTKVVKELEQAFAAAQGKAERQTDRAFVTFLQDFRPRLESFDSGEPGALLRNAAALRSFMASALTTIEKQFGLAPQGESELVLQLKATIKMVETAARQLGVPISAEGETLDGSGLLQTGSSRAGTGEAVAGRRNSSRLFAGLNSPAQTGQLIEDFDTAASDNAAASQALANMLTTYGEAAAPASHTGVAAQSASVKTLLKDPAVRTVLALLGKFEFGAPAELQTGEGELLNFVRTLQKELTVEERLAPAREGVTREAARKAFSQIKEEYLKNTSRERLLFESPASANAGNSSKNAEMVLRGQEFLQQMNPVMQALGEPALLMFPAFFQGLLAKIELAVPPRRSVGEKEPGSQKQGQGPADSFERFQMLFPLPALGDVKVDFAIRPGEIYLNFYLQGQAGARFVENNLGRLEKILQSAGFEKSSCQSSVDLNPSVEPLWIKEFVQSRGVVA